MVRIWCFVAFSLGVLLCLSSCTPKKNAKISVIPARNVPTTVAILPFSNHSQAAGAGKIVRKMFYNFFSSLNYQDVELSDVDNSLRIAGLFHDIIQAKALDIGQICQATGTDALVFGDVTTFGKIYAVLYSEVRAGLKAKMVACPSGKILWQYEHTAHISEGGLSINPLGLASTAAKVLLNLRQTIGMRVVSDLCMEMVSTIPNPPASSRPGPHIKVLVHNGANRLLLPGQLLKVVLIGQPGLSASWTITTWEKKLPLDEKDPGIYTGAYRVKANDRIIAGQVVGFLRSPSGKTSKWMDILGPVTFGRPTELSGEIDGQHILSKNHNPYLVRKILVIGENANLTIMPGVKIWVSGLGIVVRGTLHAEGTIDDAIEINTLGQRQWKGIIIERPTGDIKLKHVCVRGANSALVAKKTNLFIKKCLFVGNNWGLVFVKANATIVDSLITGSEKVGISVKNSKADIKGCRIVQNKIGGILVKESQVDVHGSDIFNNGKWNLKILDDRSIVDARRNWWGSINVNKKKILGHATLVPPLRESILYKRIW